MHSWRHRPLVVAVIGLVVVTAYAAWAALQILVLNPLAAVPGRTLTQIYAEMDAAGELPSGGDTVGFLALGPLLAVVMVLITAVGRVPTFVTAAFTLALLIFGGPAYVMASFRWGMGLADTYGIGGGDHSGGSLVLYAVSLAAVVGMVVMGVRSPRAARQGPLRPRSTSPRGGGRRTRPSTAPGAAAAHR